jgi:hypothetical protein
VVRTGAAEVWTTAAGAAVVFGGALVTGALDVVTAGGGAAGWLEAGAGGDEVVPPTAVGLRAVVVVAGEFTLGSAMIMRMPTTAVTMVRRRTDQSWRNQSRTRPTGKRKISKSTIETVRRCQGCVD